MVTIMRMRCAILTIAYYISGVFASQAIIDAPGKIFFIPTLRYGALLPVISFSIKELMESETNPLILGGPRPNQILVFLPRIRYKIAGFIFD